MNNPFTTARSGDVLSAKFINDLASEASAIRTASPGAGVDLNPANDQLTISMRKAQDFVKYSHGVDIRVQNTSEAVMPGMGVVEITTMVYIGGQRDFIFGCRLPEADGSRIAVLYRDLSPGEVGMALVQGVAAVFSDDNAGAFAEVDASSHVVLIGASGTYPVLWCSELTIIGDYGISLIEIGGGGGGVGMVSADTKANLPASDDGTLGYTTGTYKRGYWRLGGEWLCLSHLE